MQPQKMSVFFFFLITLRCHFAGVTIWARHRRTYLHDGSTATQCHWQSNSMSPPPHPHTHMHTVWQPWLWSHGFFLCPVIQGKSADSLLSYLDCQWQIIQMSFTTLRRRHSFIAVFWLVKNNWMEIQETFNLLSVDAFYFLDSYRKL